MRFLFISSYGDGAGVAYRVQEEGNEVALWIKRETHLPKKLMYNGIVPRVDKWENFLTRPGETVVVFDSTGGGKTAERLRQQGHPVFNGSFWADQMEENREYGIEVMTECGIRVPEYRTFTSLEEGQAWCRSHKDKIWCFKPSGHIPSYLTYIPTDVEDMIQYFDYLKLALKGEPITFELQEYKEGLAVSTEAWCDGRRFVPPFNHTLEKKRYSDSDLGVSTGCAGNVVWMETKQCETVQRGIGLAERVCVENGYIGAIDLNMIVNREGHWGLEWTIGRFGYDAISAFLRLYKGNFSKVLSDFARGQWPEGEGLDIIENRFAGALRLSIPPSPDEEHPSGPGVPLRGFKREDLPSCYFYEVMEDPVTKHFVSSGGYGAIVSASGIALSPRESMENGYRICEGAMVPNKHYRTDLREEFEKAYGEFASLGL